MASMRIKKEQIAPVPTPKTDSGAWTEEMNQEVCAANAKARYSMYYANKELAKLSYFDAGYAALLEAFDQAATKYQIGKYYQTVTPYRSLSEADLADWAKAMKAYEEADFIAQTLYDALISGDRSSLSRISSVSEKLETSDDVEIAFAGDVPIMPTICPVVILSGSDYDMGYQYAQQITQIYGPWILGQKAGRDFTEEQIGIMVKWEEQIKQYAPEMIDFFKGWVAGANADGIPMSYNDVLELWVGPRAPLSERQVFPQLDGMCTGVCAWGRATRDGKLVAAASTDHDCAPMATIVAFPETGNHFIYTPFDVRGTVDGLGDFYFAGHPGMNNKGLAYVHHGGVPATNCEPKEDWGYGIRRGVFTFHALRFADNVDEAERMVLSSPIGDVGTVLGYVGGFWADSKRGSVIECRKPLVIRNAGVMGETDFLYAHNNVQHPDLAEYLPPPAGALSWDPHGGWYNPSPLGWGENPEEYFRVFLTKCSHSANLYSFHMLDQYKGEVDVEFMKMLYRQSATLPQGSLADLEAAFVTGQYWPSSVGHSGNAFVSIMKPEDGDEGLYYGCVGAAARNVEPKMPGGYYYYADNPHSFWELKLASSPANVIAAARQRAEADLDTAKAELEKLNEDSAYTALDKVLSHASVDYRKGRYYEALAERSKGNESVYNWSKAVRAFTKSQIRARQVYNALVPPADKPEDMGLKPFIWPE